MTSVPAAWSSTWSFFGTRSGGAPPAVGAVAGAVAVGAAAGGLRWALVSTTPRRAPRRKGPAEDVWSLWQGQRSRWAAMSMAGPVEEVMEPTTGMTFPGTLEEGRVFTGAGLRKKSILGLKKINVYAYGVYVDPESLQSELGTEYSDVDPRELSKDESFFNEMMEREVGLTVRLVIVYGRLKVGSVRSAFEESVGSRIKKFGGAENRELLNSFTGAFTDDIQLPKGTTIDLTRLPGNILQTKIDGIQVGRIESALVCRSLFDLYIGDDPFDKEAKKVIGLSMASFLS